MKFKIGKVYKVKPFEECVQLALQDESLADRVCEDGEPNVFGLTSTAFKELEEVVVRRVVPFYFGCDIVDVVKKEDYNRKPEKLTEAYLGVPFWYLPDFCLTEKGKENE